jgi:hypothetical protein
LFGFKGIMDQNMHCEVSKLGFRWKVGKGFEVGRYSIKG